MEIMNCSSFFEYFSYSCSSIHIDHHRYHYHTSIILRFISFLFAIIVFHSLIYDSIIYSFDWFRWLVIIYLLLLIEEREREREREET